MPIVALKEILSIEYCASVKVASLKKKTCFCMSKPFVLDML